MQINLRDFKVPVSFCFLFCGGAGEGKFRVELRLSDPSGAVLANSLPPTAEGELVKARGPNTTVILAFQGLVKRGKVRVALIVDSVEHYFTTIEFGDLE
jgi:hypothetical protein